MWTVIKAVSAFLLIIGIGFFAAHYAESLMGRPTLQLPRLKGDPGAKNTAAALSQERQDTALPDEERPSQSRRILLGFLESKDSAKASVALRDALAGISLGAKRELFQEAISMDLDDPGALAAAGLALRSIAEGAPQDALSLLYRLRPAQKESLALSLAEGWARKDPLSAWDWIESAWIDPEGGFVDRDLQNRLSIESMETTLRKHGDLPLAAALASLTPDPMLKEELSRQIARYIVSSDPEMALQQFEFEGDTTLDEAVMDAVIQQWAEVDAVGAAEWALQNQAQVSRLGIKHLSKQLLLGDASAALTSLHTQLGSDWQKDSVAAEAARLLARRNPQESALWIQAMRDEWGQQMAFAAALYEIGYEDFRDTSRYLALAFPEQGDARYRATMEALEPWSRIDAPRVSAYLASSESGLAPQIAQSIEDSLLSSN